MDDDYTGDYSGSLNAFVIKIWEHLTENEVKEKWTDEDKNYYEFLVIILLGEGFPFKLDYRLNT